jgi:hypothetical protein
MSDREFLKLHEEIETLKAELAAMKRGSATQPRGGLRRLLASPRVRIGLAVVAAAIPLAAYAAQISVPYNFVNGTVADATEVNANFSALVTESNAQDLRLAAVESLVATHTSDITVLQTDVANNASDIATIGSAVAANTSNIATNVSDIVSNSGNIATNASNIAANTSSVATNAGNIATNATNIATNATGIGALNTTFSGVSRGGTPDTLTFSGMNVQVVDGSGDTDGTINGLGNLIVGYNENNFSATRTGSHNLVVGLEHGYTSYAGSLAGWGNTVSGASASVSGGTLNTASADYSSVSGGYVNEASGWRSTVSGGSYNTAGGDYSSVSGGYLNTASGDYSSVSGGRWNQSSASNSSVSGGSSNWAGNVCSDLTWMRCVDDGDCTGGGTCGTNEYQSVSGGLNNAASGNTSSVSGGYDNEASAPNSSVSGGYDNEASASNSSVSGGYRNYAGNVCGGGTNDGDRCLDDGDCAGGGTCGTNSYQAVSGGYYNDASGLYSSVSGGTLRTAAGPGDWAAGGLWQDN